MGERIRLLEVEPDLAAGLPPDLLRQAVGEVLLPAVRLAPGPLAPGDLGQLMVLEGFLVREVVLDEERPAGQLLGPGDIVDGTGTVAVDLPCAIRWAAVTPVLAARLDPRMTALTAVYPALAEGVRSRMSDQTTRALLVAAVIALPRVEQRLVALLWIVAGRWGTMGGDGAIVPVPLTHAILGRLVGSKRSTVTLALGKLAEDGLVRRREDGRLVLSPGSDAGLGGVGAEFPARRQARTGSAVPTRAPDIEDNPSREGLLTELELLRERLARQRERAMASVEDVRRTLEDRVRVQRELRERPDAPRR